MLGFFLIGLGIIVLGAGMIQTSRVFENSHRYPHAPTLRRLFLGLGVAMLSGASLAAAVAAGSGVLVQAPFEQRMAMVFGSGCVALFLGIGGIPQWRVAHAIAGSLERQQQETLGRYSSSLYAVGWFYCLVGFVTATLFFGLALVIAAAIICYSVMTDQRRLNQGTLLWQLAIASKMNLPLHDEVNAYAESVRGRPRRRARQLADRLAEGTPLAMALRQSKGLVPHWSVLMIQVGEDSGTLPAVLMDAAVRHGNSLQQLQAGSVSPLGLMTYLFVIATTVGSIAGFQMHWIIPKLKAIFEGLDTELPKTTQAVIQTFEHFGTYGGPFALLFFQAAFVAVLYASYKGWGELEFGWFTRFFRRLDTPDILRGLAVSVEARFPLGEGLESIARIHRRSDIRDRLLDAADSVAGGDDCWNALSRSGLLTQDEPPVLQSAQRVGNLTWALKNLAVTIERRQSFRGVALFELVQPAAILVLGFVVLAVSVAFFMPLVKLLNDLT